MPGFSANRPVATLSSGLLARKGQARPAMRPQGVMGYPVAPADDLGWNDLGHPAAEPVAAEVPTVLRQRETLAAVLAGPQPAPAAVQTPPVSDAALKHMAARARKAAFTLRLDADRHLRLRLAAAVRGDSAQHLVTQALDTFLNSIPEVEALVAQLHGPATTNTRGK